VPDLGGLVRDIRPQGRRRFVGWADGRRAADVLAALGSAGLDDWSVGTASLEDLFHLVGGEGDLAA
jgi:hypothetical protein